LRVEHPKHVVVRNDEKIGRRAEGSVLVRQELRIHVAVRAEDRQSRDGFIQLVCNPVSGRFRIEVTIFR
jgi:hypothetical protein